MPPASVNDSVVPASQTELMRIAHSGKEEALREVLFHRQGPHWLRNKVSLLDTDSNGRTALFYAAERGSESMVWALLRLLPGTGLFCGRGSLLEVKDNVGARAEDWAAQHEHAAVAGLLRGERMRIEYFE